MGRACAGEWCGCCEGECRVETREEHRGVPMRRRQSAHVWRRTDGTGGSGGGARGAHARCGLAELWPVPMPLHPAPPRYT
eukprot:3432185-Prymnesium_polylepis.1